MSTGDYWKYLGDAEKTTAEEYTFLARLEDWAGYTSGQEQRRKDAWHWLDGRRPGVRGRRPRRLGSP
jgi:hypothetical protein